jgi:hypothetical protein
VPVFNTIFLLLRGNALVIISYHLLVFSGGLLLKVLQPIAILLERLSADCLFFRDEFSAHGLLMLPRGVKCSTSFLERRLQICHLLGNVSGMRDLDGVGLVTGAFTRDNMGSDASLEVAHLRFRGTLEF